ncbi:MULTISPECIES: STAS domain-containing protein [Luteimonas]|uniref:STAS domain-containing protein n=1 Tax=Luteimonas TaxID=83614 RepID=UPI000C7A2C1F|nr:MULTISPECIES: STAS domain-containing protein [Luteimonas]
MADAAATVRRSGDALAFAGALTRDAVRRLWAEAGPLRAGATRLDLTAITAIDSAGLALLGALSDDGRVAVDGTPPGLADLRSAYRLAPSLAFAAA